LLKNIKNNFMDSESEQDIGKEKVLIKDVHDCTFYFRQCIDIGELHLDTFWKRLRWVLLGK